MLSIELDLFKFVATIKMLKQKQYLPVILLIALALIWGSSFILMKNGLKVYSSAQVATMRMFFSFLFLLPLTIRYAFKIPLKYYGMITLVGLLGNGIPAILFATAQTKLNSSTAGVLNTLTPIFTLVVAAVFFKQTFSLQRIAGVVLGLLGAIALIMLRSNGSIDPNYTYGLYILLATICYAWSVNLIKEYLHKLPALGISSLALLVIGPVYGYYLFYHTDFILRVQLETGSLDALFYVVLLAMFGTALSLILFNKLVQISNIVYASSVTYLIPIVALFWGIIDGEQLNIIHFIGMSMILLGVYLANRKK
ncbi:MAG: DMT family transporter [bacterium]|jgi:drug/metabolite transporter (DMT)-like permease